MKHGIVWFFHLDRVIVGVRIALIPLFLAGMQVRILGVLFPIIWATFGVCAVISLLTLFVLTPSGKSMERFIETYESEFGDRVKLHFSEKHRQVTVLKQRCYADGRIRRVLHNRVIYGTLVMLAVVTTADGKWIVKETKALTDNSPRKTETYRIDDPAQIHIETTPDGDDRNARLVIRGGEVVIDVLTYDDYHLRDLIASLKGNTARS